MNISNCFEFGYITKTHGLKGEVMLQITDEPSKPLDKIEILYILNGGVLLPYFLLSVSENNGKAICKFEDINTQNDAIELKGKKIFLPNTFKFKNKTNEVLINDLINYTIIDKNIGVIGTIVEVYEIPNNPLLSVIYQTKEVLIPYNAAFIISLDQSSNTLKVNLPDGLLDVYLSNNHQQDDGQ